MEPGHLDTHSTGSMPARRTARRAGAARLVAVIGLPLALTACGGGSSSSPASTPPTITAVAAGNDHSLALDDQGNVWTWGSDDYGQLGNGTTASAVASPAKVSGLANVAAISAGVNDSVALTTGGSVWAWGYNGYGELGDGTTAASSAPVQVTGAGGTGSLTNVVAIAAGADHVLALESDGTVWAWGNNAYGQLGDGTGTDRHAPVQVTGLANVIAVAAGAHHSLALRSDGTVWAWGSNASGQLGDGTTTTSTTPIEVVGVGGSGNLTGIVAIAAGTDHSLALTGSGAVYAWGGNGHGQLGNGTTAQSDTPIQVAAVGGSGTLTGMAAIAAGDGDSLALGSDGIVRAWGYNNSGEIGDGTTTDRSTPVEVSGLTSVTAIAAGGAHSIARRRGGTAYDWGNNLYGQLAVSTSSLEKTSPVQVVLP